MNNIIIFITLFCIVCYIYYITYKQSNECILQPIITEGVEEDKPNCLEEGEIEDIFYSDMQNLFSETTNQLINASYDDLINNIYTDINMTLSYMENEKEYYIQTKIMIEKNNIVSENFIELLRYYGGCTVFKFNKMFGSMFMGDYLNNNSTTNLNANRTTLDVSEVYNGLNPLTFIPAMTISMLGIRKNNTNEIHIGSIFVINLVDITDKKFINTFTLIPFGKIKLLNVTDKVIHSFFANNNGKMRIRNIGLHIDNTDLIMD